jgi:hypothetical protein
MQSKYYYIAQAFVSLAFLISLSISIISISLLNERYGKREDVEYAYKNLEIRYTDVLKNFQTSCEKGIEDQCKSYKNATSDLKNTLLQAIRIKAIENRGAPKSICASISAITSGSEGFENACNEYHINHKDFQDPSHKAIYASLESEFKYCGFDKLPSEILYLLLVMSCSLIGSSYNFKSDPKGILNQSGSDIFRYLSLGFIAYVITTGAKFVVLLGNQQFVTNVNPYSIALVGILAGMFFDRFFVLKDNQTQPITGIERNDRAQSLGLEENKQLVSKNGQGDGEDQSSAENLGNGAPAK